MVCALTNAVDGIATQIANGIIQIIDLALAAADEVAAGTVPGGVPADAPVGRFANLWGVSDVVDLGGVLHAINPRWPQPVEVAQRLVVSDGRLVQEPVAGFGAVGEPVQVERDARGAVVSVRIGAMTSWPAEEYRARALS